ncbi:hypothetical protein SAMN05421504_107183 [Amycolatopsis xylanica]|uniref:Novel STAND NTPase 1 domain-containing protein n=1 Tax=Amycolatopsis xylanica TaxID=589385 RepID=A0A1H3N9A2_9PSEU|nr:NACHT and WD repeat domain-containing protein [Amycolatopsis xylanica]SDY85250.1 hypothetical protein SAMN05421504_107183 [Amycolatopsis xylanica]
MEPSDPPTTPLRGIHLEAHASGDARIQLAARDQHIYYRDGVRARRRTVAGGPVPECPYPGLAAFGPEQADWFFGRDGLVAELIDRLDRRLDSGGVQVVLAPSGAGKSSLLRAGLLPALDRAALPGSDRWPKLVLTPTTDPLWVLAANLAALTGGDVVATVEELTTDPRRCVPMLARASRGPSGGPDTRVVVVVDQFEELFTLCADDRQRRVFIDLLVHLAESDAGLVVIGVRADFYPACADRPRLRAALQDAPLVVGPMSEPELREAILYPAEAAGLQIEPGLVELLLRDLGATANAGADREAGYEAGRLPLLAHALRVCWQQRNGSTLTVRGYQDAGGIQHAIATTADRVHDGLDAAGRLVARALFLRLIRIGEGTEDVRRSVSRAGLLAASADPAATLAVLAVFTQARLLTQREDTVEVTHEALLTSWPRLREWIGADRDWLRAHQQIADDTESWRRGGRDVSLLYRGTRLAVARQWLPAHGGDLNEAERDYLDRSYAQQRTQTRRRLALRSGLALVVVVALVLGALYWYTNRQRDQAQVLADSRALAQASQDVATSDPALSVMTALAAYRTAPTQEARNQLLREYLKHSQSTKVLSGLSGKLKVSHTSRDGEVVFASTDMGRSTLFVHAATGTVRAEPLAAGYVVYSMVAPDGKRAAFIDETGTPGWFDVGVDGTTGPVRRLPKVAGFTVFYNAPQDAAALSADGRMIAVGMKDRLVWWDLETGVKTELAAPPGTVNGLWIGADDRTLLVKTVGEQRDYGLVAVDLSTGLSRAVLDRAQDRQFLMSGDRTAVATCLPQGDDQSVYQLVRVADGAALGSPYPTKSVHCGLVGLDADGRRVLVKDEDGSLLDLVRGAKLSSGIQLPGLATPITDLIASGDKLLVAYMDTAQLTYTELPPGTRTLSVVTQVLTRDGAKTISLLKDGSLQLRPADDDDDRLLARAPAPQPAWDPDGNTLGLSGDGTLLVNREGSNVVVVRETESLREVSRITTARPTSPPPTTVGDYLATGHKQPDNNFGYYFDHSGNLLTVADTQVQSWDPRTGDQIAHWDARAVLPPGGEINSVGPYPAANQVAVVISGDPVVRIVDLITGRTTTTVETTPDLISIQFDAGGRYFALLRQASVVELWRRDPSRRELGPFHSLTGINSTPWVARFLGGDGRFVIAANNSIRIHQIGSQAPVDSYEFGHPNGSGQGSPYYFIDLSSDGKTVLYADDKGIGGTLSLDPASWMPKLCGAIGYRDFTPDERAALPASAPPGHLCQPTG